MEHPVARSMYMDWKGEEEMGTNLFCHYFTTRKRKPPFSDRAWKTLLEICGGRISAPDV